MACCWHKGRNTDQWDRAASRNNASTYAHPSPTKMPRPYNGQRTVSSTNGGGTTANQKMKRGSYMIWEDVQVLRHNTRAHNRIVLFQKGMSTLAASHVSITLPLTRNWNGEGNGTPLQYPCLENHMGGGACWAAVHGVTRSRT